MRKAYLILLLLFIPVLSAYSQTADEILDRFAGTLEIPSIQGSFTLELISGNGDVRTIRARAYQKLMDDVQNNRLFIFDFPPTVRGTGLLIHSYTDGRENNMWIYLPAIRRVKRIALESSGGGYFMGSDFAYSDLINTNYGRMNYERLPDTIVSEVDSYGVRAWGKTPQDQQEHGYKQIISYYRKDNFMVHRREFFDFNGELLKVYKVEDFLVLGEHLYPTIITMTNVQTNHRSVLKVTETSTEEIPDGHFTTRFLQNN